MKKRFWILGSSLLLLLLIVATVIWVYGTHFASAVNPPHKALGALTVTPQSTAALAGAETFSIVPAQTTASYSVYEDLIFQNKPNNDAIGTTHSVEGTFAIRTGTNPQIVAMKITVDLRTLQSDSQMRDHYVSQNSLQSDTYPYAVFVSVSTQGLPASYSDGENVHFQLVGNLTMHGKTNQETFDVQGEVSGNTVTGTATSTIYMTDFGIQPPDLANIAVSQNKVQLTLKFTAQAS
jgi:polyisoprenoid-binding protein YceI